MLPKAKGDSFNLVDEESEQSQDETESGSPNKPSTIIGIMLSIFIIFGHDHLH